ncbi:MAG TPA: hypothetical protein VK645_15880 [Chitinophagaceae bacterium]|nr:hypothetical protein [Chitinophagaceae bacterium]
MFLTIKAIVFTALVVCPVFILCACFLLNKPAGDLRSIELITSYPTSTIEENGVTKALNLRDTINIFYYKSFVLYKLSGVIQTDMDSEGGMQIERGHIVPGSNPYFYYKKNDEFDWRIPASTETRKPEKFRIDSFLLKWAYAGITAELPDSAVI